MKGINTGANLSRKYKNPTKKARVRAPGDVSQDQLYRDIQNGFAHFMEKRGGLPVTGSFGDTFNFGKQQKTA